MRSRLRPLFKLFYTPAEAMTEIAAGAPYLVGTALALLATLLYREVLSRDLLVIFHTLNSQPASPGLASPLLVLLSHLIRQIIANASPLFFLLAVFVPVCLLAASLIERRASFRVLLRQEYASLASCALYGWTAAHLMMIIPALMLYQPGGPNQQAVENALRLVPIPYFIFLMVVGLHAALRLSYGRAVAGVAIAACSLVALPLLSSAALRLLASPFLLILVILLLRNFLGDVMGQQRAREDFERNLQASTLNPADASAHYNLGLIHQKRGQHDEARARFMRAIEIDPEEIDAHYQLGRIAREQNQLADAINHFDAVVRRHPEHNQSEVWREIGSAYLQAEQYQDARAAFERFIEKRPSDAEGHYRYGLTLHHLGRDREAAEEMRACIEAAKTSPSFKYRTEKRWMSEAESFLRAGQ
jgi:tetratricopeptide (TPR) repeat protein